MRLLILSDLHLEVWRENAPAIRPASSRPDVVILAGDIDKPARALAWAERTFAGLPVIYVSGNHEAYGDSWEGALRNLARPGAAPSNVRLLNRSETVIGGVRFLGATLWTDYALFGEEKRQAAMAAAEPVMLDYRRIQVEDGGLHPMTPDDTVRLHRADRAWLAEKLETPFDGRTVVVTHMAPSLRSVATRYAQDLVSAAFSSNLDALVERADLWVHGHTHDSFDYRIGNCRVICNPCGYLRRDGTPENERYNPDLIVEA
ncbi:metallophosphoesterase family protein [Herbaspirillum sp. SJZ099]|uniref:metallophosphoesterase family protein n=1 Tax=Herbaspirillum sp. SJZ099 TaxID=2572916 RepID=UPI0011AAD18C|nr:metallophosphoesterase family protein [Herbaspirillum sp. SJZ099]TWC71041.1 calcineurin-like phosphoesterase family protein [Herbaspirillum sp. SJZ099]